MSDKPHRVFRPLPDPPSLKRYCLEVAKWDVIGRKVYVTLKNGIVMPASETVGTLKKIAVEDKK